MIAACKGERVNDGELGFIHEYVAGQGNDSGTTLLLLHGTGGDETSLTRLGELLSPGSARLSPRGKVLENGTPRFFRRIADGVFDIDDLTFRTLELAGFVRGASDAYGLDTSKLIAVGYSNGANIAASLMLLVPGLLRAAVLFRAMVLIEPESPPDLTGIPVYLASGRNDQLVAPGNAARLAEILRGSGAEVDLRWTDAGHRLSSDDVGEAGLWLSRILGSRPHDMPDYQ